MNNCSVCKKPVDEHLEGRETDRCVAEKLGWNEQILHHRGVGKAPGYQNCSECFNLIPHYSSPTMSAEVWGLEKKLGVYFAVFKDFFGEEWFCSWNAKQNLSAKAPTAPLAICRAFLCMENE